MLPPIGYLCSLQPQNRGIVRLEKLTEPVLVIRDDIGVPCIAADTEQAAFFALGYVHAQDRLWQMEVLRRAAWGELFPLLGEDALGIDLWHRRIGFYRKAMTLRSDLRPREQALLKAYAAGISSYLRAHPIRLPPEFLISRLRPSPWKTEDVLAIGAMIHWLSVPCSLRIPAEFTNAELRLAGKTVSPADLPRGLNLLHSHVQVRTEGGTEGIGCRLSWGATLPTPWHEAALRIGNGSFRRGWVIPGWPVAHVVASHRGLSALETRRPANGPWTRLKSEVESDQVLEFLDNSPLNGYCDTVMLQDDLSLMRGLGEGTDSLATEGAPGMDPQVIALSLGLWGGGGRSLIPVETTFGRGAPFGLVTSTENFQQRGNSPRKGSRQQRLVHLRPLLSFRLLDLLFTFDRRAGVDVTESSSTDCPWIGEDPTPIMVEVRWSAGKLSAIMMGGVSGVPGSPHRMDQMRSWSEGELIERSVSYPVSGPGCVLLPLGA